MKQVMVTGAFGNVGRSTILSLIEEGYGVHAFDRSSRKNRHLARVLIRQLKRAKAARLVIFWGDIRDKNAVDTAAAQCDCVIHLAAIIPPLADRVPELACSVNVGGTRNIIASCENSGRTLIHASSIALYGDRVKNPAIHVEDPVQPAPGDVYGSQKARAEELVRNATCPWTILRLSYVVSRRKLAMDPIMFRMPLDTCIEIVHTEDAGRAFVHAIVATETRGKTFNIGGGDRCRTTYREYLNSMLTLFGLGRRIHFPEAAFARQGYHCGWLDSEKAEQVLRFQRKTLADYYVEVAEEARRVAVFVAIIPGLIFRSIMHRSPYPGYR